MKLIYTYLNKIRQKISAEGRLNLEPKSLRHMAIANETNFKFVSPFVEYFKQDPQLHIVASNSTRILCDINVCVRVPTHFHIYKHFRGRTKLCCENVM